MTDFLILGQIPDFAIIVLLGIVGALILIFGLTALASRFYQKVGPDEALVRTGWGGMNVVTANGIFVAPVIHHSEKWISP